MTEDLDKQFRQSGESGSESDIQAIFWEAAYRDSYQGASPSLPTNTRQDQDTASRTEDSNEATSHVLDILGEFCLSDQSESPDETLGDDQSNDQNDRFPMGTGSGSWQRDGDRVVFR